MASVFSKLVAEIPDWLPGERRQRESSQIPCSWPVEVVAKEQFSKFWDYQEEDGSDDFSKTGMAG